MLTHPKMMDEILRGLVSTPMEFMDQFMSGHDIGEPQLYLDLVSLCSLKVASKTCERSCCSYRGCPHSTPAHRHDSG